MANREKTYLRVAKKLLFLIGVFIVLSSGAYTYDVFVLDRFRVIDPGKVYKSGVMSVDKLEQTINKYNIKSIIDLRDPQSEDAQREGTHKSIISESALADRLHINYYNLPSQQVPSDDAVHKFLKIMNEPNNYPVLIHCYHGKGRAVLYSALYRIEYQDFNNSEALEKTRLTPIRFSSFAKDKSKGQYIMSYVSRT